MSKFLDLWKTTVHVTYDRDGKVVHSHVDKGIYPSLRVSKLGIEAAGPVPNSLLAEQDLEGENREKNIADDTKLYQLATDSREVDDEREKDNVVDKIKEVQEKRQKATLKDRGVTKSFKDIWKSLRHD